MKRSRSGLRVGTHPTFAANRGAAGSVAPFAAVSAASPDAWYDAAQRVAKRARPASSPSPDSKPWVFHPPAAQTSFAQLGGWPSLASAPSILPSAPAREQSASARWKRPRSWDGGLDSASALDASKRTRHGPIVEEIGEDGGTTSMLPPHDATRCTAMVLPPGPKRRRAPHQPSARSMQSPAFVYRGEATPYGSLDGATPFTHHMHLAAGTECTALIPYQGTSADFIVSQEPRLLALIPYQGNSADFIGSQQVAGVAAQRGRQQQQQHDRHAIAATAEEDRTFGMDLSQ